MKAVAIVLASVALTLFVIGCSAIHFGKLGGDW